MNRRTTRSTRTDKLLPYTTLCRSRQGSKAVHASSRTAAANASGGARQGSAAVPGPVLRAETPPAPYCRRWCDDAPAPALPAAEDAPDANEPLPPTLPDRKSVVKGQSDSVRVPLGGRRSHEKQ